MIVCDDGAWCTAVPMAVWRVRFDWGVVRCWKARLQFMMNEIDFGIILLYMYVRNQLAIGHPAAVTIVSAVRNIAANVTNLLVARMMMDLCVIALIMSSINKKQWRGSDGCD